MAAAGAVKVEGLRELVRDFRKMGKHVVRDVQRELGDVAKVVADEARSIAEAKDLRRSGDLVRSIRPRVRGATALVRASATHRGFNYPRRFEFEGGRRGASDASHFRGRGPRAFLGPALDAKEGEIVDAMNDVLDRLTSRNGFRRGGVL